MTASKNWTLNATAAAQKKFGGGLTGQSKTSTPWKFDSVTAKFDGGARGLISICNCL